MPAARWGRKSSNRTRLKTEVCRRSRSIPRLEQQIAQGVRQTPTEISLMMEPKLARHVVETLSQKIQQLLTAGQPPVHHVLAANPPGLPPLF